MLILLFSLVYHYKEDVPFGWNMLLHVFAFVICHCICHFACICKTCFCIWPWSYAIRIVKSNQMNLTLFCKYKWSRVSSIKNEINIYHFTVFFIWTIWQYIPNVKGLGSHKGSQKIIKRCKIVGPLNCFDFPNLAINSMLMWLKVLMLLSVTV